MKYTALKGRYYDLIRVPHGHIPVSKLYLWKNYPIEAKETRTYNYFQCPECGNPSFFKVSSCEYDGFYGYGNDAEERRWRRVRRRERNDYFRRLWKDLEGLALPFLVLIGKAWYVRSDRLHYSDPERRLQEEKFWAEARRRQQAYEDLHNLEEDEYWADMGLVLNMSELPSTKEKQNAIS